MFIVLEQRSIKVIILSLVLFLAFVIAKLTNQVSGITDGISTNGYGNGGY